MARVGQRVLVTRPEPGASETAARLEALGFAPSKLPLHQISPLSVRADTLPGGIVAVAVTSANAIRNAPASLLVRWLALPCFAVGDATAGAARAAGFQTVVEGGGDANSLAEAIIAYRPTGPVTYICGRVRRPLFEEALARAGVSVVAVETYDTVASVGTDNGMAGVAEGGAVGFALVYSANAAKELARIMVEGKMEKVFEGTEFLCISERAAEPLAGGGHRIAVAAEPNEAALIALLDQRTGHTP